MEKDLNETTLALPSELTVDEMIAGLGDVGETVWAPTPEWRKRKRTIAKGLLHSIANELIAAVRRGYRGRTPTDVRNIYEATFETSAEEVIEHYGKPRKRSYFRLGSNAIVEVEPRHVNRFLTQRLGTIVAACNPDSICEVGCGHGRNLFYLANRFNQISCAGFDLTASAINTDRKLQQLDLPKTNFGQYYGLNTQGMENVRRINFLQGSAFDIPAPDKSFDLVFTNAALEQMHIGYEKALSEIRRVTRRYVLLLEPFADCNDSLGQIFLWANNYFRIRVDELRANGLEPIHVWTQVPVKPTFAYSFVLCRPL